LDATIDEFRIYDTAFSADDVSRSVELGPDVSLPESN
jgi:hypothetical protein